jgi:hypothetical protein
MDASTTGANIVNIFGQQRLYNPCVGSDTNRTHRSTKDDSLPEGRLSFWEHPTHALIRWGGGINTPQSARILSIKPAEVPIADCAIQAADKSWRDSIRSKCWLYDAVGETWLVWSWWHGEEHPAQKHRDMIERGESSEGWTLSSLGDSAGASAWTTRGTDKGLKIHISKHQLEGMPVELKDWLSPKRVPVTYRVQGEHRQVWLPI